MASKPAVSAPKPIAALPTHVVNRIAAGEIIQRPANALKELVENALDAGGNSIKVTIKEGGIKLLQIQDNGSGIRKADLGILCERFTTSKIASFDDLSSLSSYGFRGEALASISHVAHLTVTTKTRDEPCAWKAAYSDGVLVPVKSGGEPVPVPCAGNDGTLIVVEDLFYPTPQRLRSLKSASEEYQRILTLLNSYAIHNSSVSFSCKKAGSSSSDLSTPVGGNVRDNIGTIYGEAVKRELVEFQAEDGGLGVKVAGWATGPNYQGKKATFLFFINHRLVDSTPIRRALEAFYSTLLPKGSHAFVYLSINIDPSKVDVNVHPTKKEVGFEDEEEVVSVVCDALAKGLENEGGKRKFTVQTLLPGAKSPSKEDPTRPPSRTKSSSASGSSSSVRKIAPNKLVRTDHHAQTLDALFHSTAQAADDAEDEDGRPSKRRKSDHDPDFAERLAKEGKGEGRTRIPTSECMLKSVKQLRQEVMDRSSEKLEQIVRNHIFVGVADLDGSLSMVQHQTKLYLANHAALSEELFYQLGLRQFGRFVRIKLRPAPSLKELLKLAVESEGGREEAKMSSFQIVEKIYKQLMQSREMLDEYFSFGISENGEVETLPLLLPGYTPNLNKLPLFLVRLGVQVDWKNEKACFETFLQELAFFYVFPPPSELDDEEQKEKEKKQIQHAVFPAAKQYLVPPERMLKRDFVMVTSLESLYKVFERC
ncbi:DNA mismatch repair protein MLH1 [Pseudohyphozyma bogoriensis]|nr:DNA mismatch repair protein MLH1 [Pseudohyphozyma bogoriensis]